MIISPFATYTFGRQSHWTGYSYYDTAGPQSGWQWGSLKESHSHVSPKSSERKGWLCGDIYRISVKARWLRSLPASLWPAVRELYIPIVLLVALSDFSQPTGGWEGRLSIWSSSSELRMCRSMHMWWGMCNYSHTMLCEWLTALLCNVCHILPSRRVLVSLHLTQRMTTYVTGGKISAELVIQWGRAPVEKDI